MSEIHAYGLSDADAALVADARRLASTVVAEHAGDVDRGARFPSESLEALARGGWLGLCVGAEYGGRGAGPRAFAGVVEELAQACGSTAMVYVMHVSAVQAIAASTALRDREATLREIVAGRHLTTLALSERGSRSQFWAPVSSLVARDGGWEVSAEKSFVTAAGHADSYVASARSPGADSPLDTTLYLTRASAPGVRVAGGFDGLGLRGNQSAPVAIEGLRLRAEDLLSPPGGGTDLVMDVVLPWFAVGTAAMANGLCRAALAATVGHLTATRFEPSGAALRDLPNLRARVAAMSVRTEQSRTLLRRALDGIEHPSPETPLAVLQSRLAALEAAVEVTDLAMKTCGGAAFSRHLGVERLFRDARAGWVMAPTVDHLQDFVGKALTGLPLF